MPSSYQEVRQVCFVGAGTMGCFNALIAGSAGLTCTVVDKSAIALDGFEDRLRATGDYLCHQGLFSAPELSNALSMIAVVADLAEAVTGADLISESVPEQLALKKDVLGSLDRLCDPHTIITTNTSSLLPSELEGALAHGNRFAALHSHLGTRVFDIVGATRTDPGVLSTLENYVEKIGGFPLMLKRESRGYVINAILGPLLRMSLLLVARGKASVEQVDRIWMESQGAPVGPFGLMDLFGIDVVYDSWTRPRPGDEAQQADILSLLTPYIDTHSLGVKTGQGFYSYPNPAYADLEFTVKDVPSSHIRELLMTAFLSSAVTLSDSEVAEPAKIDEAWRLTFSVGYGPLAQAQQLGSGELGRLCKQARIEGLFT
jgi:3-hydroxyacyl-CoA dehydrogenase